MYSVHVHVHYSVCIMTCCIRCILIHKQSEKLNFEWNIGIGRETRPGCRVHAVLYLVVMGTVMKCGVPHA